jgi:hypothetical protein
MQTLETLTLHILNKLTVERQLREQRKNQELEERDPRDGAEKQDRNPTARHELSVVVGDRRLPAFTGRVGHAAMRA